MQPTFFLRLSSRSFRTRRYLHALDAGDFKAAEKILKLGIDPQTALKQTILLGPVGLLQTLVFSGAHLRPIEQESPFRLALASPHDRQEKLQVLANSGADLNGTTGSKKLKLLNWAILQRDGNFFDFLLRAGADVHTADRAGLTPLVASQMLEESGFERRLLSLGAQESPYEEGILEHLVINENLFLSELYQLIKWCVKNAGFKLNRVTLPRDQTLCFRIQSKETFLRLELALLPDQQITLFAFKEGESTPFSTLLPFTVQLDSQTLRGHVVTVLKEIERAIQSGTFKDGKADQAKVSTPQSPEIEKALQALGLSSNATEQEIIAAYRTLAKRYHPDLAKGGDHGRMSEINRAYESLRK